MGGTTSSTSFTISQPNNQVLSFLSKESRYSGMAQQLRGLAARAKDLGSIPGAHTVEGDSPWIVC